MTHEEINGLRMFLKKADDIQGDLYRAREVHKLLTEGKRLHICVGEGAFPVYVRLDEEEEKPVRYQLHQAVHRQVLKLQEQLDRLEIT